MSTPNTRSRRTVGPEQIKRVLKRTFGLSRLRDGQEAVIGRILHGLSTLALMPTGAGKSLCYQVPAVLLTGRTVVISPLIALMKDQCDALTELGIAAVQMHSGLSVAELEESHRAIADGSARIVFTTPEQLMHADFVATLAHGGVALLVVDEAHCLSQWGFDFRPAFLEIGNSIDALGRPPVLALTATATESVVDDIIRLLAIPRAGVIGTDLFRPNLHYRVEHFSRAEDKLARTVELARESEGVGLVYAATIKAAEALHEALDAAGEPAGLYHGRLSATRRHAAQDGFMNGDARVMVATNAFGLGIDKPDVRFVIHHQVPSGLDAYCQESGRAGRDGAPATCTLMFVDGDRGVQQFFLSGRYPQRNDFRGVIDTLARQAPDPSGWQVDALADKLGSRRKVAVAVNLMRQSALVHADDEGRLTLSGKSIDDDAVARLLGICEDKSLRDRAMLERMIAYAQSGQCRWRLLLEHLEGAPTIGPCGTCDNCLRLAAHEAQRGAEREETETGKVPAEGGAQGNADAAALPLFAVGDRVRTRRHGEACVTASDTLSVTVQFDNGQSRNFQPQFLRRVRRGR